MRRLTQGFRPTPLPLVALLFTLVATATVAAGGAVLKLDLHHRFSSTVRASVSLPGEWPEKHTADYYSALAAHDVRRSFSKSTVMPEFTFLEGNITLRFDTLGYLHYALVTIGKPEVTLLVALDTGSDLFWVPCDCRSCAETVVGNVNGAEVTTYNPNISLTSQELPCKSIFCDPESKCMEATSVCSYRVAYVSSGTSSSGILVEDILHLTTENSHPKKVEAPVVLGCGQVQTGSFLNTAAPYGLLGLGMDKLSVPSILSSRGLTSNSFSMCFGRDGFGRISFGDKGSLDQEETSFDLDQQHNAYSISITGVNIGNNSFHADFSTLVDTGTSFTFLSDPAYTVLTENFKALVQDEPFVADSSIPFKYCFQRSSDGNGSRIPGLSFITKGGSKFPVTEPIVVVSIQQKQYVYCLAVVKSSNLNIIGQNFLTGLRVVFDRERGILGWKKFNCYDVEDSDPLAVDPSNSSISSVRQDTTTVSGNGAQVTHLLPNFSYISQLSNFLLTVTVLLHTF